MAIYSLPDLRAAFSTRLRAGEGKKLLKPDLNTHLLNSAVQHQVPAGKGTLQVKETPRDGTCPTSEMMSLGP